MQTNAVPECTMPMHMRRKENKNKNRKFKYWSIYIINVAHIEQWTLKQNLETK